MVLRNIRKADATRSARTVRITNLEGWAKLTSDELRAAQTEILNSFADFCVANQLSYFLYAGTLLGSVRHEGYIPWDDDIDIVMPRRDYDRLHLLASGPAAIDGFSLCSAATMPGFPWPFAKIANNTGTLSLEDGDIDYAIGINIDIFPLDGWPNSIFVRWIHDKSLRLLRALMYSQHISSRYKRSNLHESVLVFVKPFVKIVSLDWLIRKTSSCASRYSSENSDLVGVTVWGYAERVTAQAYTDIVELRFEEGRYRVPVGYDAILRAKYGDYMRLPPPELQLSHSIEAFRVT